MDQLRTLWFRLLPRQSLPPRDQLARIMQHEPLLVAVRGLVLVQHLLHFAAEEETVVDAALEMRFLLVGRDAARDGFYGCFFAEVVRGGLGGCGN